MGATKQEVLQKLLSTPRRRLIKTKTDGSRELTKFYQLVQPPPNSTKAGVHSDFKVQLHAVFDFLLEEGCPSYVSDYVNEVCQDPRITSSNPLEACILDGTAVLEWCQSKLSLFHTQVTNDFLALKDRRMACKHAADAESLCLILTSLKTIAKSEEGVLEGMEVASHFRLGFQVAQWCSSFAWVDQEPSGPFSTSYREWHCNLKAHPNYNEFFCSLMAEELGEYEYPFKSAMHAVQKLFFPSQTLTSNTAIKTRIHLLGYFLMDAGYLDNLQEFLSAPFDLEPSETRLIEGKAYFDRHRHKNCEAGTIDIAMSKFELAMPFVPFSIIETLVRFGHSQCALRIWNGQRKNWAEADLIDFRVVTQAWLQSRGPALALDAVRKFVKDLPAPEKTKAMTTLIGDILDWGLKSSEMEKIIHLPLLKEEEEVYISWAKQHWEDKQINAYFPLFYILRSRMLDAIRLVALAEIEGKTEADAEQVSTWQRVNHLVRDARRDLPNSIREKLNRITSGSVTHNLGVRSDEIDEHDGSDSLCSQRSSWPSQICKRVVGSPLNENSPSAFDSSESNGSDSSGPSSFGHSRVRSRSRKLTEYLSSCAEMYSATKRRRSSLPASIDAITGMR